MIDIVALYEPGDVVYVPCVVKKVKAVVESTSDFGLNKNKITSFYYWTPRRSSFSKARIINAFLIFTYIFNISI